MEWEKFKSLKKIQKYRNSSKIVLLNISIQLNIRYLPDKKYFFWKIFKNKKRIMHDTSSHS